MNDESNNSILTVSLDTKELWYLLRYFPSGIVFGLENPYLNYNEEEINNEKNRVVNTLIQKNIIIRNEFGLQVDEMVGSMVYSLINFKDQIIISDQVRKNEIKIHFLPNWILGFIKNDDLIEMILFKDIDTLWDYITHYFNIPIVNNTQKEQIHLREKDFELLLAFGESNRINNGLRLFGSNDLERLKKLNQFVNSYNKTKFRLGIIATYNYQDIIIAHQKKYELVFIDNYLYWIQNDAAGDNSEKYLVFKPCSFNNFQKEFLAIIPKKKNNL